MITSRIINGVNIPVYTDYEGQTDTTVCTLNLSAAALDFIIEHLPDNDVFTDELKEVRDIAMHSVWSIIGGNK